MRFIYLHSFLLIPLVVSDLCLKQSAKCKKEQRAITPKIGKAELQFFCTALLLNKRDTYNIHTKLLVHTTCSFKVMSWTRCVRKDIRMEGQTDLHTDRQSSDYMLSL